MKCPHCKKDMGWNNHGVCEKCNKYCGCSFNPTSLNDFCSSTGKNYAKRKRLKV